MLTAQLINLKKYTVPVSLYSFLLTFRIPPGIPLLTIISQTATIKYSKKKLLTYMLCRCDEMLE